MTFSNQIQPGTCLDRIRVFVDGILDDEEIVRAAGAVGYAFRVHFHGEGLSEPQEVQRRSGLTSFILEPNGDFYPRPERYVDFLSDSIFYIAEGTPVRKTDRSGPGTRGTRLINGLSRDASIKLMVQEPKPEFHRLSLTIDGEVVFTNDFVCLPSEIDSTVQSSLDDYISTVLQDRR